MPLGIEHGRAVDQTDAETGQIVVVRIHDTRVLGHLAADERAARLLAALADAGDDLRHLLGFQLADGDVVEEEQRLGAGREDVVGAHGHQVDAHRVVLAEHLGDLELGAHAVGAAHEQRIGHVLRRRDGEQAAETADVADDLGAVRLVHDALDGVNRAGALRRVNAGLGIRHLVFGEQAAETADVADDLGAVRLVHDALDGVNRAGALRRVNAGLGIRHLVFHCLPFEQPV